MRTHREHLTGNSVGWRCSSQQFSRPKLDGLGPECADSDWKRLKSAYAPLDQRCRLRPVDHGFQFFNFVGISHAFRRLWRANQAAASGHFKRFNHQPATQRSEFVVQGFRGVQRLNRELLNQQHVAGVEPRIHLHDGDAGMGIAGFYRPVNRCGASPAREQGGMDVQTTKPGRVKHPLRQDQSVCSHHHDVCTGCFDSVSGLPGIVGVFAIKAQAAGLCHRDLVGLCPLLDGGLLQLHAAPGGTVRLTQDQRNFKTSGMQLRQRHPGKLGRACKNNAHRDLVAFQLLDHFGLDPVPLEG